MKYAEFLRVHKILTALFYHFLLLSFLSDGFDSVHLEKNATMWRLNIKMGNYLSLNTFGEDGAHILFNDDVITHKGRNAVEY